MPLQATTIEVHYSQANAPVFLPSNTRDDAIELMDVWMIPLMPPPPYFIEGGTPKATLDKIELMVASVPVADIWICTNSSSTRDVTHVLLQAASLEPK